MDVIQQTLERYSVSIFAYRQTGSGKSYTMFGPSDNPRIIPMTLKELLRILELKQKQHSWKWCAKCTMVELYLNEVKDLLNQRAPVRIMMKAGEQKAVQQDAFELTLNGYKALKKLVGEEASQSKHANAFDGERNSSKTQTVATCLQGATEREVRTYAEILELIQLGESS